MTKITLYRRDFKEYEGGNFFDDYLADLGIQSKTKKKGSLTIVNEVEINVNDFHITDETIKEAGLYEWKGDLPSIR